MRTIGTAGAMPGNDQGSNYQLGFAGKTGR
jgi:hypothetical protein